MTEDIYTRLSREHNVLRERVKLTLYAFMWGMPPHSDARIEKAFLRIMRDCKPRQERSDEKADTVPGL